MRRLIFLNNGMNPDILRKYISDYESESVVLTTTIYGEIIAAIQIFIAAFSFIYCWIKYYLLLHSQFFTAASATIY